MRRVSVSPFGAVRRTMAVSALYGVAAMLWAVAGAALPGGRWLALHLFTLGTLTNAVSSLSLHFGQTLMHARPDHEPERARLVGRNVGVLAVLVGVSQSWPVAVAVGSTAVSADVVLTWWLLRRARKRSLPGRFAFVVRSYERACEAFLFGALLGALLGSSVLEGRWYGAARLAHLHVMLFGWAGLPILATAVFFVPTLARARILPGADRASARALRVAPTLLTVATVALLLAALGGVAGDLFRILAAVAVLGFALAAADVGGWAWRAGSGAAPPGSATLLRYACLALPAAVTAQGVLLLLGEAAPMNAIGAFYLSSVLVASLIGSAPYLLVMSSAADAPERRRALERAARGGRARLWLLIGASASLTVGYAASAVDGWPTLARNVGWWFVLVTVAWALGAMWGFRGPASSRSHP